MTRAYTPALSPNPKPREIAERVNAALRGKINSVAVATLAPSSATTVLTNENIGLESLLFFTPLTESARSEGSPRAEVTTRGEATLYHANGPAADRTFGILIVA